MKLSFVIPAYNEQNYLGKCLQSIIREKQKSRHEIEIIVVNNASTDQTKSVAQSFADVKVVDEPRKGLLYARQAGFKAATGDLIANVDADTVLTPGWIETVFKEFAKHKKMVALSGPYVYYDMPLSTNIGIRIYYYLGYISYIINRFILRIGSLLQGGNFVIRRSALEKIGGFNLNLTFYGEDTDIAKRLSAVGGVKFTFKLPMYTSGRRLKTEGVVTMAVKYPINYFWTTFFNKPYSKDYIDIRHEHQKENKNKTNIRQMAIAMGLISLVSAIAVAGFLGEAIVDEVVPHQIKAQTTGFHSINLKNYDWDFGKK